MRASLAVTCNHNIVYGFALCNCESDWNLEKYSRARTKQLCTIQIGHLSQTPMNKSELNEVP